MAYNTKIREGCKKVKQRMREAKEVIRLNGPAPEYPLPVPNLRRIVIIIDFDFGKKVIKFFKFYKTKRIDSYYIIDEEGTSIKAGWARFINLYLMKCFVRVKSTYNL
jgi:hypothetical protein